MLLGIPGDNTYSNYQEATRSLWRATLSPPPPMRYKNPGPGGGPLGTGKIVMRRICFALAGFATLLASPAALAADADVLSQFGMHGRQAIDCNAPHSQNNPHSSTASRHRAMSRAPCG